MTDSERLQQAGLRVTAPRLATLEVLREPGHLTAEEVYQRVAETLPGTSLQAVYNVLAAFTEAELVRRVEFPGSPWRYESRVGDNHHHVVCSGCGAVADIDCVVGHAPCLTPSDASGFVLTRAEVTFFEGLCTACAAAADRESLASA